MRFKGVDHYPLRLLIGIILWDFFSSGSLIGIESLSSKSSLLTKVYFPRSIIVLSGNITAALTLLFNLIVLAIFLAVCQISPSIHWLAFPLVLVPLELMLLGVSFALGALKVFYGDVMHIWEVVVQIGFWATPIIYPLAIVPEQYRKIIMLSPFARCIEEARAILIEGRWPDFSALSLSLLISLIVFVLGYGIFVKQEPKFAEAL